MLPKKAFSLVEVIVSITILAIVGVSIFFIRERFAADSDELHKRFVVGDFGQYVSEIVERVATNTPYDRVGEKFYIKMLSDSSYAFDNTPSLNTGDIGFPLDSKVEPLYHSVSYIGSNTIGSTTFKHYRIDVSYFWKTESFYVTK